MSSSGAAPARPASREIARAAVQAELSLAAYDLVVEKGYDNVTLDDMAAAGGVSRSTFLRYFNTKDQAILVALKAYVERMADALRSRPSEEDDWAALRSAIESFVVPIYTRNPTGAQAISRLAMFTRTLSGAHLERADWRTPLTAALAERHGIAGPGPQRVRHALDVSLERDQDRLVLGTEVAQERAAGDSARRGHVVERDVVVPLLHHEIVGGHAQLGLHGGPGDLPRCGAHRSGSM